MWTSNNRDIHLTTVGNQMTLRQEAVLWDSSLNWPMITDPAGRGMWLEGTLWDRVSGDQDQQGAAGMGGDV